MTSIVGKDNTREVRMWDLVKALRANGLHAADCPVVKDACREPGCLVLHVPPPCDCWCNPETQLQLVVNG